MMRSEKIGEFCVVEINPDHNSRLEMMKLLTYRIAKILGGAATGFGKTQWSGLTREMKVDEKTWLEISELEFGKRLLQ